jgi:catechol 2,3-dioxygenase-like lactoylglutathione lyase family enzyme
MVSWVARSDRFTSEQRTINRLALLGNVPGVSLKVSLDHAHIFASDIALTLHFFVVLLGAEVIWDEEAAGARNVRLRLGSAFIHLYDQPPRRQLGGPVHHLGIATDDLDQLVEHMKGLGHVFRKSIKEEPRFRYVMVEGPDHLLLELFESKEPQHWQIRQ